MKGSVLGLYLQRNIFTGAVMVVSFGLFMTVFFLYSLPLEAVAYATLLTTVFMLITGVIRFRSFYKRHNMLNNLKRNMISADFELPASHDLIEQDYQELIKLIDHNRAEIISQKDRSYSDMMDYYSIWAHQIKTPIAAMRLVLQSERSDMNFELLDQLFKVEQYVEMVMQYLRMESMGSDLVVTTHSLDDIVKQAVKKYAKSFIRKRIKLNYESLNCTVLTDEKWLVFVVEQILSNALNYTNHGAISIHMDDYLAHTLVIKDTGIGIEPEDLPRVFEKGFTGYNGRLDKKSTGIGLYLCKQILNKLSHNIRIESGVGEGTEVKIGLNVRPMTAD